jgi:two-component system, NtrC family, sensor histidine kinase KinB
MKRPIRTRFTLGMIFIFLIILVLSVFSGYYIFKLSAKTSAILKENYLSIVYAREMSESIMNVDQEIINSLLIKHRADSLRIRKEFNIMDKSLQSEKNNITEAGEGKLVSGIEAGYLEYRDSVFRILRSAKPEAGILFIQNKSNFLHQQLSLLSEMNGKALELKTDDAKASSNSAVTKMTFLATLCFLIGMTFTISFSSYFNRRFLELYNEIKEIVSSNSDQHQISERIDEFDEISLVINEMADKLKNNKQKMSVTLQEDAGRKISSSYLEEIKMLILRLKNMEEQAVSLLAKFDKIQE